MQKYCKAIQSNDFENRTFTEFGSKLVILNKISKKNLESPKFHSWKKFFFQNQVIAYIIKSENALSIRTL